jgi:hypothetical protein
MHTAMRDVIGVVTEFMVSVTWLLNLPAIRVIYK